MRIIFALTFSALHVAALASARDPGTSEPLILAPDEIAARPATDPGAGTSGLPAIRMTVLFGNPVAEGPYTIALEVPPLTAIAAHTHKDTRTAVVVRGAWIFGYGKSASKGDVRTLGPGSFYSEPAGLAHFARTGPEGATVYISGYGP